MLQCCSYLAYGPLLCGAANVIFEGVPVYPNPGRMWDIVDKLKVRRRQACSTAKFKLQALLFLACAALLTLWCWPGEAAVHSADSHQEPGGAGQQVGDLPRPEQPAHPGHRGRGERACSCRLLQLLVCLLRC